MTTYATMRNRIVDDLIDSSLTTAQINQAIQTAIKFYERKEFYFNQKTASFATVAAQEYYGAAALSDIPDIIRIISATVTSAGSKYPLLYSDFATMDAMQDGAVTSMPRHLAYFGQQIRLYPIPDTVYTMGLSYIYRFAALSADGDTNAWMTDGEELIRQSAKRRLGLDIQGGEEIAMRAKVLEDEAYDELLAESRRRLPNQELKVPAMLQINSYNINIG